MIMKLGMEHYVLKLCKVYINDDSELTLTHFKTMSKLAQISGECLQDHWSSGFTSQVQCWKLNFETCLKKRDDLGLCKLSLFASH